MACLALIILSAASPSASAGKGWMGSVEACTGDESCTIVGVYNDGDSYNFSPQQGENSCRGANVGLAVWYSTVNQCGNEYKSVCSGCNIANGTTTLR